MSAGGGPPPRANQMSMRRQRQHNPGCGSGAHARASPPHGVPAVRGVPCVLWGRTHAPHAGAHGAREQFAELAQVHHQRAVHDGLELGARQAEHLPEQHLAEERVVRVGQRQACECGGGGVRDPCTRASAGAGAMCASPRGATAHHTHHARAPIAPPPPPPPRANGTTRAKPCVPRLTRHQPAGALDAVGLKKPARVQDVFLGHQALGQQPLALAREGGGARAWPIPQHEK